MSEHGITVVQLLAHVLLVHGSAGRAATLLAALDLLVPQRREVLRALALAQLRDRQPQAALETLQRAALTGGLDAAHHLLRARALTACDRRIEALASMSDCLALRAAQASRPRESAA